MRAFLDGVIVSIATTFLLAIGVFSFCGAFSDQTTGWLLRVMSFCAYLFVSLLVTSLAHEFGSALREHDERVKVERETVERQVAA